MKIIDAKGGSVHADAAPKPVGAYPHAKRAGDLLFLSGIGPRKQDGSIDGLELDADDEVLSYDIESQCRSVFTNIDAVLNSAGAQRADLVDITVFLTDIARDFATFNKLYADYVGPDGPARTTVEINRLPTPIAIELKCIARLPESV